MSIFVVLSGFVVTLGYGYEDLRCDLKAVPYMLKRVSKILPLHIIMLCVRLLFDYLHGIETSGTVIFLNITMLKSFIPVRDVYYSLGGVTWYLTLIWVFALLTPLLLKLLKKIGKRYILFAFVLIILFRAVWIFYWHTSDNFQWLSYINPFFRATDYFLGMMLGVNINTIKKTIDNTKTAYAILGCLVWGTFLFYIVSLSITDMPWYHIYLRTPLSLGLITLFMCFNRFGALIRTFVYENKLLIYIGNISFELFLIHIHVRNIVNYEFSRMNINNSVVLLVVVFGVSVSLAQLYSYVDRKVRKTIYIKRKNQG